MVIQSGQRYKQQGDGFGLYTVHSRTIGMPDYWDCLIEGGRFDGKAMGISAESLSDPTQFRRLGTWLPCDA